MAIKVRGTVSAQREARETLEMLHLSKSNHAVLVENSPSMVGMLKRVQSYVTWGEISNETVAALLMKRGRLAGDKKLTEEYAQKTGYKSLANLQPQSLPARSPTEIFQEFSLSSSYIHREKASRARPRRVSAQAARQGIAEKP